MVCSLAAVLLPGALLAQDAEHVWDKSYSVSGKPALTIETGDSNLEIHSCGECRAVHIHVDSGRKLSDYRLEESQAGDQIHFALKEKPHYGISFHWKETEQAPRVTVETPAALTLDARTSDGNLLLRDVHGEVQIHTDDGNADIANVEGNLHLTSGDGNVDVHNASGTLEARASDGRMKVDGKFTSVQMHTSDGNLDLSLADGSQLASASRVESSDGQVKIRVPRSLAADLDVSTSDGHIDCSLPLTMDHYNSHDGGSNHLHGKLNAGGVPLSIHTSDGSVSITNI
jgi:DUF4097 and DUF4098 domain-containing protein YvlB